MLELHLCLLVHSEVKKSNKSIVTSRQDVIVLQDLDSLDVIRVSISVRMYNFSARHIEVSQDKIVASRVKVILDILNSVDSLFVVFEGPQMEFFLGVHNLYLSSLVSRCEDSAIRPDANRSQIIDEIDLPRRSLLPRCSQHNRPSMAISEQLMRIVVVGDSSDGMRVALQHLSLVLLPISLLVSEFVPALRRGEDFQLVVAQLHALLIIIICMHHANLRGWSA